MSTYVWTPVCYWLSMYVHTRSSLSTLNPNAYQLPLPGNSNSTQTNLSSPSAFVPTMNPSISEFPLSWMTPLMPGSPQQKSENQSRLDLFFFHLYPINNKFLSINSEICLKWICPKCVNLKPTCLMINFLMIFFLPKFWIRIYKLRFL